MERPQWQCMQYTANPPSGAWWADYLEPFNSIIEGWWCERLGQSGPEWRLVWRGYALVFDGGDVLQISPT
eukprot:6055602-Alexandrium_andersonii.AAC.1